jgi:hypothetical protein
MPNPFKDELIIRLGANMVSATSTTHVKVMTMEGRTVKSMTAGTGTSVIRMNTADMSAGMYVVEVSNDKNTVTRKAIKQ